MTRAARLGYPAALGAVLLAGVLFRSWGVVLGTPLDLWADEAWWLTLAVQHNLAQFSIRPVGYLWLVQHLARFDDPELMLRLPSCLAAVGALACTGWAARRSFTARPLVVLAVALVALHPQLVVFAKEFKPYAVEVFVHAGLMAWALHGLRVRRLGVVFVAAALAALPFCYNVLFLYPGLAAAFVAVHRPAPLARWNRRSTVIVVVALVVAALAAVRLHGFASAALDAGARAAFWGDKYGVFPRVDGLAATAGWYLSRTWHLLCWPGASLGWHPLATALASSAVGIAAIAGAGILLARGRFAVFALLAGPTLLAAVANALGYWPYGVFRTNTFLLPGLVLLVGHGLQALPWPRVDRRMAPVLIATALAVAWPADLGRHFGKRFADGAPAPQHTRVLDALDARLAGRTDAGVEVILADWHSWRPLRHYLGRPRYAALDARVTLLRGSLDSVDDMAAELERLRARAATTGSDTRVWLVVTKLRTLRALLTHPLVERHAVDRREFETGDAEYHPVLVELRFPAGPAR